MKRFLPNRASRLLAIVIVAPSLALGGCSLPRSYEEEDEIQPRASLYILTAEQIKRYPSITTVEQLLEQHFSTLNFRPTDERPGGSGTMYMLGVSAPLFVVDGVPIDYKGSLGLNPRDIESIELVKHGASAFYGFRGSGGAILITTKNGREEQASTSR